MTLVLAACIAYLIGSISSAIIVCRLMGLPDPRSEGSLNPGATNVLRIGGKKAASITLLGDLLKGVIPVLVAKWLGLDAFSLIIVALAAFLGHIYPIFFHFIGGKGVATNLGCLLALSWPSGFAWVATWLLVAKVFRYSSLAAIIASLLAPFYIWYFTGEVIYACGIAIMSLFLIYRHRSNIIKLIQGNESKLHQKKS